MTAFATIGIGTTANDGTGDSARTAFGKVNDVINALNAAGFSTGAAARPVVDYATAAALPSLNYVSGVMTATANGALSVDGASPAAGKRILVKDQAAPAQNGVYDVTQAGDGSHPFILTRSTQYDTFNELAGAIIVVEQGTANADTTWQSTANDGGTIGSTSIPFVEISAGTINSTKWGYLAAATAFGGGLLALANVAALIALFSGQAITWGAHQTLNNTIRTLYTMVSGNAGYVTSGGDNTLIFRGGPAGYKWDNNADTTVIMTLSDAGVLAVSGAVNIGTGAQTGYPLSAHNASGDLVTWLTTTSTHGSYLELGIVGQTVELSSNASGDFLLGCYGGAGGVVQSIRSGAATGTVIVKAGRLGINTTPNNSNFILDVSGAVARVGYSGATAGYLQLGANGTDTNNAAIGVENGVVVLYPATTYGGTTNTSWQFSTVELSPGTDNTRALGDGSHRLTQLFAVVGTINTSDAREKTALAPITPELKAAIRAIFAGAGIYQWLDAVAKKGADKARLHIGVTSQDVEAAFSAQGLDPNRYAIFCEDVVTETVDEDVSEERQATETIEVEHVTVETGVAMARMVSIEQKLFDAIPVQDADGKPIMLPAQLVRDEAGNPVLENGSPRLAPPQPRTIQVPRMETVTVTRKVERPKLDAQGQPVTRKGVRYDQLFALALAVLLEPA